MTTPLPNNLPHRWGCGRLAFGVILAGFAFLCVVMILVMEEVKRVPRVTQCGYKLKQISIGLQMYLQDYDERFPPSVENAEAVTLPALLHPYARNQELWECPTVRKNGVKDQTYDGTRNDTTTSYGYNGHALAPGGKGVTLSNLGDTASTLVLVETDSILAVPAALAPKLGGTPPVYRHPMNDESSALNVGWADGHVKRERPGKLEATATEESGKRLSSGIDSYLYWNRK